MNRKLHNTMFALTASGALLVLGLVAAVPAPPGAASLAASPAAAELNPAAALAGAIEAAAIETLDSESPTRSTGTKRSRRQALVMPYFSFVPRG
ncbi:hypothetical protein N799_10655 [Lysobacter arseniciresistens ZS79]|uniref:Secreted protein n=1 Tax=Lysobacter arseniciresistens ZS79 TaxID=913325 RepID=A0A0A0F2C0_9GAMM|nr:hypothetical protein [Lysobacter arseniciresistens]KGM57281.1 hypothetical protein N799_10655 [Lysobacter arseniciresistens ZS79]